MDEVLGKNFGKYRIVSRLGSGGMAEVYKAYQANLDRHVALKLMHAHLTEEPGFIERFELEAKNIAALRHPHIVQIYDFDLEGQTPYIVMELVDGPTLKAHLDQAARGGEPPPLAEVIRVSRQVGQALAYAHGRHMVHRDVKPGNVMLDADGRAILTDFGLSKILGQGAQTGTGGFAGTPAYMAPELGQGSPGDHRADIYALGVMLFEMVAGRLPYESDSAIAVMLMHITEPIPSLARFKPDVPERLEGLIRACLAKDPEARIQTMEAMLAELELCQPGAAAPAAEVLPPPPIWQTSLAAGTTTGGPAQLPSTHYAGVTAQAVAGPTLEIQPPPEPTVPPAATEVIGREAELATYAAQLSETHLAVISGLPGVGKTTLAAALAARVCEPAKVFWHTFHEGEGVNVLLWKLAGFLAWRGQGRLWHMLQAAQLTGNPLPPMEVLFDYLFQMLQGSGYLLCLDDLHHVEEDPQLAEFLDRLQKAAGAGDFSTVLVAWRMPSLAQADTPALGGLCPADTQQLLIRRGLSLAPDLVESIHRQTGGNAQCLMLVADNLRRSANPARLVGQLLESDSVERFLMQQVDKNLGDDEREVIGAVAVLMDYPGSREAISAALDGRSVRGVLNELRQRHLVTVVEDEAGKEYGLNVMMQAFYYDQLGRSTRQAMHGRVAEYYETEEPDALRAARHFQRSGDAAHAARLATSDVWGLLNRGQARALRQVLEQFNERGLDKPQWAAVLLARGRVADFLGEVEAGVASYQAADRCLAGLPDSPEVRRLRLSLCQGMGELLQMDRPAEALDWLKRGLTLAAQGETQAEAALRIRQGRVLALLGQMAEAEVELQNGLALLPAQPSRLHVTALGNLANIYAVRGETERGLDYYRRVDGIARQLEDRWLLVENQLNIGLEFRLAGRFAEALVEYRAALREAEQLGNTRQMMRAVSAIGNTLADTGDLDEAAAQLFQALELTQQNRWETERVYSLQSMAGVQLRQGAVGQAEALILEAQQLAGKNGLREPAALLDGQLAEVRLAQGRLAEARSLAEQAVQQASETHEVEYEGLAWRALAKTLQALGEAEAADAAFERCLGLLDARAPLDAARARQAWGFGLRGRGDEARAGALLRQAEASFQKLGARPDRDFPCANAGDISLFPRAPQSGAA